MDHFFTYLHSLVHVVGCTHRQTFLVLPHGPCAEDNHWKTNDANNHLLPSEDTGDNNCGDHRDDALNQRSMFLNTDATETLCIILDN